MLARKVTSVFIYNPKTNSQYILFLKKDTLTQTHRPALTLCFYSLKQYKKKSRFLFCKVREKVNHPLILIWTRPVALRFCDSCYLQHQVRKACSCTWHT